MSSVNHCILQRPGLLLLLGVSRGIFLSPSKKTRGRLSDQYRVNSDLSKTISQPRLAFLELFYLSLDARASSQQLNIYRICCRHSWTFFSYSFFPAWAKIDITRHLLTSPQRIKEGAFARYFLPIFFSSYLLGWLLLANVVFFFFF